MVKIRKTASIENGLMEVITILSEEEIQEAIGKGSSYIRKCSNPDLPQQIDHNDSFKLDRACIKKGKGHPLLTSHEYMVTQELEKSDSHEDNDIDEMLVRSTILHGKLTEVVKQSEDPKSDMGKEISPLEKKEIMSFSGYAYLKNVDHLLPVVLKDQILKAPKSLGGLVINGDIKEIDGKNNIIIRKQVVNKGLIERGLQWLKTKIKYF